jgi:hypothetical protein
MQIPGVIGMNGRIINETFGNGVPDNVLWFLLGQCDCLLAWILVGSHTCYRPRLRSISIAR